MSIFDNGVLLVFKKSQYELYIEEHKNPVYMKLIDEGSPIVSGLFSAHLNHLEAIDRVMNILKNEKIDFDALYRADVTAESVAEKLIISIGGDGTALDVSHRITTGVLLGVNSDPERSIGFLCAANAQTLPKLLAEMRADLVPKQVYRVNAEVNGVSVGPPALNEILYCDQNPAATSRYVMSIGGLDEMKAEEQKSSGVWISSAMGSTGAIYSAGGHIQHPHDSRLQLLVREPYFGDKPKFAILKKNIHKEDCVYITSKMREGALYIDGSHGIIPVDFGSNIKIQSGRPLNLILTDAMKHRRR